MSGAFSGLSERCHARAPVHSGVQAGSERALAALRCSGAAQRQRLGRHALVPKATVGLDAEALQALERDQEVSIRRHPPTGFYQQGCGPLKFHTDKNDGNTPRNILEEIVWFKSQEVADMKYGQPLTRLMIKAKEAGPGRDFVGALREAAARTGRPGLIAEVKKASPSRGVIQADFDHLRIARQYEAGGAACLSVLTDARYFQGSFDFLQDIRAAGVACPLLCKEFIVEAYQLYKARAYGADAVLLIAAVLPNKDLDLMVKVSQKLGLQCLIEVHTIGELERVLKLELDPARVLLGINNRDLATFEVTLDNTRVIMASPAGQQVQERGLLMLSESGIFTPAHVKFAAECGCGGILVGESLVKQPDTTVAVQELLA